MSSKTKYFLLLCPYLLHLLHVAKCLYIILSQEKSVRNCLYLNYQCRGVYDFYEGIFHNFFTGTIYVAPKRMGTKEAFDLTVAVIGKLCCTENKNRN